MTKYLVLLGVRAGGSACGSTEDLIEADTAEQAESYAISAWREVRPDRTFHPLLTLTAPSTEGGGHVRSERHGQPGARFADEAAMLEERLWPTATGSAGSS